MTWAHIAGLAALLVGLVLIVCFVLTCRHMDSQEKSRDERDDDFI